LRRSLPPRVFSAACDVIPKIIGCRTEANGFATLRCQCGYTQRVPFTCKARFCPSCGVANAARAAEKIRGRLLNVRHRHMVFTIPQQLRWLFFRDRRLLKLFSDAAAQTLLEIIDRHCKAARVLPGIVCTVHTFGQALNFHPHVHVLVTEGGLQGECKWQPVTYFSPVSVGRRFQYHLLTALRRKFKHNRKVLALIGRCFDRCPNGFGVNLVSAYRNAWKAAAYCCRYTGRPPIAESRIIDYDGRNVTYGYKDYASEQRKQVTVSAAEFLFLLLQHLPPKNDRMVRYYGLYARRARAGLFDVVALVSKFVYTVPESKTRALRWRERLQAVFETDPYRCPNCGKLMQLVDWHYPPPRGSPDAPAHWKRRSQAECNGQLSLCPL